MPFAKFADCQQRHGDGQALFYGLGAYYFA